jgi:hypothetical protein
VLERAAEQWDVCPAALSLFAAGFLGYAEKQFYEQESPRYANLSEKALFLAGCNLAVRVADLANEEDWKH